MYATVPMQAPLGVGQDIPEGLLLNRSHEGHAYRLLAPELLPMLLGPAAPLSQSAVVGTKALELPGVGTKEALVLGPGGPSLVPAVVAAKRAMDDGQAVILTAESNTPQLMVITRDVRVAAAMTGGTKKALVANEPSAGWTVGGGGSAALYVGLGVAGLALLGTAIYVGTRK